MVYFRSIAATLLLSLAACTSTTPGDQTGDGIASQKDGQAHTTATSPSPTVPGKGAPDAAAMGIYPESVSQYQTTAGSIYLANLNARIDALKKVGAEKPGSTRTGALAGSIYHRFQILGKVADGEQALALLDRIPDAEIDAVTRRQRAGLRSGFHRFDEARSDLEKASSKGRPMTEDDLSLRGIALARGDYAAMHDDFAKAGEPSDQFNELVLRGNLAALEGDLDTASLQFFRAQSVYSDSSPYQLAWLFAQQGVALERFGHCDRARVFFDAALVRLPDYALAMDHLGECLLWNHQLDAARPIYAKLIKQTGNPEYLGAMAVLEKEAGNAELSEKYRKQAVAGYQKILATESVTWSQHAAEFYLAIGEPKEALLQARNNLENRKDVLSLILFARAAHKNGLDDEACSALHQVHESGLKPPEIAHWKDELPASCPS